MTARKVFLVAMALILLAASAWASGQMLTVRERETQMRAAPSFTGGLTATLAYGQKVEVVEDRGAWLLVNAGGASGWVHRNALTDQEIRLASGSANVATSASAREVSMAGKGFSVQTEEAYRQAHPQGYAQVDAMAGITYSPEALRAFLAAGEVGIRRAQ